MVLAALISVVLATCPAPPLFDMSGPVCSDARQGVECGCSECMAWDAPDVGVGYPPAEYYVAYRDGVRVGDTRWRNREVCDVCGDDDCTLANCVESHWDRPTMWCVAWDSMGGTVPFVAEGVEYTYTVRGCRIDDMSGEACSVDPSNEVRYVGAPYRVWP